MATATRDEVTRMLRATGSTDPDVLHAARTEYIRTYTRQRRLGAIAIVAGCAAALLALASVRTSGSSVGAAERVGVAIASATAGLIVAALGYRARRTGASNVATVDAAHREYVASLPARRRRATTAGSTRN